MIVQHKEHNPKDREEFHAELATIANGVTILSLLGLILSLITNGIIFGVWGLNFFVLAVPSDIIMSGANTLVTIFVMLLIILVISAFYAFVISFFRSRHLRFGRRNDSIILHDIIPVLLLAALLSVSAAAPFIRLYFPSLTFIPKPRDEYWLSALIYGQFLIGSLCIHIASADHKSALLRRLKLISRHPASVFCFVSALAIVNLVAMALAAKPTWEAISKENRCETRSEVVWLGSESLVVRCGLARKNVSRTDAFVVLRRSDVVLRKLRTN